MSIRVVVAPLASADLIEIRDYLLSSASKQVAARVLFALHDAVERLADGTSIGHSRLDLAADPIRFYLVYRYFVVYRFDSTELFVFRILHTARDIQAILS